MRIIFFITVMFSFISVCMAASPAVTDVATVIALHRVGDSRYPSTNLTTEQFKAQLAWLHDNGYHVWSLEAIVDALKTHKPIPPKTVGISFDDAYASVYENAWPILKQYDYPFTIFVATDTVGRPFMMSWAQLASLARSGVTIGNHSHMHPSLPELPNDEAVKKDIQDSQAIIIKRLGVSPRLFAYPYGEYTVAIRDDVEALGFDAAFSQTSGVISLASSLYSLPRFPLNEEYGSMVRFKEIMRMQPLRIKDVKPADTLLIHNPPHVEFTLLHEEGLRANTLQCYASNRSEVSINKEAWPLINVTVQQAYRPGRAKLNCTAQDIAGVWHWASFFYLVGVGAKENK